MRLFLCFRITVCSLSVNMLKLVNLYRKYYELDVLKPIPNLQMASDLQANTMCKSLRLTHDGIKGRETVRKRAEFFNFIGLNVGENIAKQENDDYKEVFKMWLKSQGHRKNILGDYDYTAVTTCRGRDGNRYWVQVFGKGANKDGDTNPPEGNDQPDGELGDESVTPLKNKSKDRFSNDEKQTPISYETTISISRKFDKPTMSGVSTIFSKQPIDNTDEESENMEFLFREGEDTQKVLKKIPPNYQLSFKGNFKKYVALKKKPRDRQKEQPTESALNKRPSDDNGTKMPNDKVNSNRLPESICTKSPTKNEQSTRPINNQAVQSNENLPTDKLPADQPTSKHPTNQLPNDKLPADQLPTKQLTTNKLPTPADGNQLKEMLKTILDKIKGLEDAKKTNLLASLTIDLPKITESKSTTLSSLSSLSSLPVETVTDTKTQAPSTQIIYKTVFKYKDPQKESTSKEPLSSTVYKTTKIGSISVLDSESKIKTITVTLLKDSLKSSSQTISSTVSKSIGPDKPQDDEDNISEFDTKVKKLFKDLVGTKKKRLYRISPNLEKDTESRLKDYVMKLIDSEEPFDKDCVIDCNPVDIGEPAVD